MKTYSLLISIIAFMMPLAASYAEDEKVTVQMRYGAVQKAMQSKNYRELIEEGKAILAEAPGSPFAAEVTYNLGVAYFHLKDYDLANHYFSKFLDQYATPNYFEQAIVYKYKIAEEFERGSGRHMFGVEKLPKWVSAWEDALELYDEVIKTLPTHEVAAQALFRKAAMLRVELKYKEALEAYRTITRRFPKHPLAPESYVEIARLFYEESQSEYPDRDFLQQARLNLKRFKRDFPSEERITEAEMLLVKMQDAYARDLWASAKYFEKKKKYDAARLYYEKIARLYPESSYAREAVAKLTPSDVNFTHITEEVMASRAQDSEIEAQAVQDDHEENQKTNTTEM